MKALKYICFASLLLIIAGCSSSRKMIEVMDDSTIKISRAALLDSINARKAYVDANLKTYYARRAQLSSSSIPLYNNINAKLWCQYDAQIKGIFTLPFPVVEVGRVEVTQQKATLTSKFIEKKTQNIPQELNPMLFSVLTGTVPNLYKLFFDEDFSNFKAYIMGNQYFLYKKAMMREVTIVIDQDFYLKELHAVLVGNEINLTTDDYEMEENLNLPHKIGIEVTTSGKTYQGTLNTKGISINGNEKPIF